MDDAVVDFILGKRKTIDNFSLVPKTGNDASGNYLYRAVLTNGNLGDIYVASGRSEFWHYDYQSVRHWINEESDFRSNARANEFYYMLRKKFSLSNILVDINEYIRKYITDEKILTDNEAQLNKITEFGYVIVRPTPTLNREIVIVTRNLTELKDAY